jgi:hypothetical protein
VSGSFPFASHFRAGAAADLFAGAKDGWGRWDGNDRLRVFLRAVF